MPIFLFGALGVLCGNFAPFATYPGCAWGRKGAEKRGERKETFLLYPLDAPVPNSEHTVEVCDATDVK